MTISTKRSMFGGVRAILFAGAISQAFLFGCAPAEPAGGTGGSTNPGSGGASSGGAPGSGGASSGGASSGGAPGSGGASSGGASSGGATGSGGRSNDGSGGSANGGTNGGTGGSASGGRGGSGTATGGTTGSGGSMGGGGTTGGAPQPSTGCGKANPATGSSGSPLNISSHNYYVKLPSGYDANKPYKVMIVFPPTGNAITWSEQSAKFEQYAPDAIRVYTHMRDQNSGWQPNETSFFGPFLDDITSRYCIDKSRIFAGGESSGGEFAGFVGCEYGDRLRGVIPNAPKMTSWKIDVASHNGCKGNPTAIVSWSEKDNVLTSPAGAAFRDFYRTLNMCQTTSMPVAGYTDALSNCKMYDGCKPGSNTYFCMHQDPNYSNTYHGWPGFIAKMSWEVFSKL